MLGLCSRSSYFKTQLNSRRREHRCSEIIDDSVLYLLHQLPSPLELGVRHLFLLGLLEVGLVDTVLLQDNSLHLSASGLLLCHLLLPLLLLLPPYPLPLLHQPPLSRLH